MTANESTTTHTVINPRPLLEFQEATSWNAIVDPHNRRIKLYGMSAQDFQASATAKTLVDALPGTDEITKLTIYASDADDEGWCELGFAREAVIKGYFLDRNDASLYARYYSPRRRHDALTLDHDAVIMHCNSIGLSEGKLPEGYSSRVAGIADAEIMSTVMTQCFTDYPSDFRPATLRANIADGASHFRIVFDKGGEAVAAASLELDHDVKSAEVTDCATLPSQRGKGLMTTIMQQLEGDAVDTYGIRDLYTIARAAEPGMNKAFAKCGYTYTGRLINNCRMPLGWESMNVWCKQL